jgi:hypothetical protein
MTMNFVTGWEKPKIAPVPVLGDSPSNKQVKNKAYIEKNNQLRLDDAIFLTFFNQTDVRNAVQKAVSRYKKDAAINTLLADMIGSTVVIDVDQGTHQAEDRHSGGFKLHFDARRPDKKCFHMYVGQDSSGALDIIEISYMNGQTKMEEHPV